MADKNAQRLSPPAPCRPGTLLSCSSPSSQPSPVPGTRAGLVNTCYLKEQKDTKIIAKNKGVREKSSWKLIQEESPVGG